MNLQFPCQQCGATATDPNVRVPGHRLQGRVLLEQRVCPSCQQRCLDALNAGPLAEVNTSDPTKCCLCADSWGAEGPYYVHVRPLATGAWKTAPACKDCFSGYHECCKTNAKGG